MRPEPRDETRPPTPARGRTWLRDTLGVTLRLVLLAGLWWIIAGGDPSSWVIGAPAVVAAAWAVRGLGARAAVWPSPLGLLRFLPYFVVESLRGGIDVAARVLGPRMRVDPGVIDYPLRLRRRAARVFFVDCISLLPGTLGADLVGDTARVHALDVGDDPVAGLRALEVHVARVFREPLAPAQDHPSTAAEPSAPNPDPAPEPIAHA